MICCSYLYIVYRWWKELDFESKLPYARNRAAECYLWTLSVYYEPQYSLARIILVKTILVLSVTDDTYDAYGTFDELKLYTDAIQRYNINSSQIFRSSSVSLQNH